MNKLVLLACCALLLASMPSVAVARVSVSVMLPLDMMDENGLTNPTQLQNDLYAIKQKLGADGVMTDVWWGLVERSPRQYNWTAYGKLFDMAKTAGLKMQVVMSFHRCGGNVGDDCNIPLPSFVTNSNSDIFYKDMHGWADQEYISLGADSQPVLDNGRTPLAAYGNFMNSFASEFGSRISAGDIDEIQVGLGPCGELRYPAYQGDRWTYCGVGEFQCYDSYMKANLQSAATAAGHSEWGGAGPNNAGTYNSNPPSSTGFFGSGKDNFSSDYGKFFLGWYFNSLLAHGNAVLSSAKRAFSNYNVDIAAKVAGIHWWYADASHAAELTAGYYNTNGNDGYGQIAGLFSKYGVAFDFTCLEMFNAGSCGSRPQDLVQQVTSTAHKAGLHFSGENGLELCKGDCNTSSLNEIITNCKNNGPCTRFTYLRLTRSLLDNGNNVNIFKNFINSMHSL